MCKKILIIMMLLILSSSASAYTLISHTNITATTTGTSWYFGPRLNVSVIWQDDNSINTTLLYLNYSLLRDGAANVSASNDYENITVLDGGNYTFLAVCTPALANITGAWANTTTCNTTGFWDVIRYITEYDTNACGGANTTYNETNTTTCFYCWPLNSNLTLGQTFNITQSCCAVHNWSNGTFGGYLCASMADYEYEVNKMFLAAIILAPLLLAFLLVIISNNLDDDHTMFKVFLNLLTFPLFFTSMYLAVTIVGEYITSMESITKAITITVWVTGAIFFVILTYYMIWITRMTFELMNQEPGE